MTLRSNNFIGLICCDFSPIQHSSFFDHESSRCESVIVIPIVNDFSKTSSPQAFFDVKITISFHKNLSYTYATYYT